MTMRRAIAATLALCAGAGLLTSAGPAAAEITKQIRPCGDAGGPVKLCPSFTAAVTAPKGWVADAAASRAFGVQILLPDGQTFNDASARIYIAVRHNPQRRPLTAFAAETEQDWRTAAASDPAARIATLPDLPRGAGRPPFLRRQVTAPGLKEQGFEIAAITADGDRDGNSFVVTVVLSSDSRAGFDAALAAWQALVAGY